MEVEYGEAGLRLLCERFMMPMSALKREFREFKASLGMANIGKLRQLVHHVNTLPVSTATCERGFSKA